MLVDLSKCLAQTRAHKAFVPGTTVCLAWGRGIGKSFFQRLAWYLLVAQWDGVRREGAKKPGIRIVLLMPTLEQAKKVHADLMLDELENDWAFLGGKVNRTTWRVTFPGGSWIQWVSAERAALIRGLRCDIVSVDEADDIDPELLASVSLPWFSEPFSLKMLMIGGTPRRGRYGLLYAAYKYWPSLAHWQEQFPGDVEKARRFASKHASFHATAYDAPKLVDPDYVEEVRGKTAPEIFAREWLCDFDAAEGLVYPMFDESFHVRRPPKDVVWRDIVVGADHGWEDPGVLLIGGVVGSGRDAELWLLKEVYAKHRESSWWEEQVRGIVGPYPRALFFGDPSRPDVLSAWGKLGARVQETDNSIEPGVMAVADRMVIRQRGEHEPRQRFSRLYISPDCRMTIRELGMYRRKRDTRNPDVILDAIEDKNNHAMDALRYLTVGYFGRVPAGRNLGAGTDARA